jgi:Rps23 Pro-64 3,4-dihydroxylase Tpa1-like proline 4-hydroxylase
MNLDNNTENIVKINQSYLDSINETDCLTYFGSWINDIDNLNKTFIESIPFEHIVIDDFLESSYAEKLYDLFPTNYDNWYKYMNPIEVKYTYDKIHNLHHDMANYFYFLSSNAFIEKMRKLTSIHDLTYDEYLHGAGLHCHPRHGRLNIHLDYEKHPYSGKERRINIIYFLNKEWQEQWNGHNELWNENVTKCIKKTEVKFNRAIIFKTNDISWHGLPEKIQCPENIFRKSLAYYYVSPLNSQKKEELYRKKAKYVKRPNDIFDSQLDHLYNIRPFRRITQEDMYQYLPNWKVTD